MTSSRHFEHRAIFDVPVGPFYTHISIAPLRLTPDNSIKVLHALSEEDQAKTFIGLFDITSYVSTGYATRGLSCSQFNWLRA